MTKEVKSKDNYALHKEIIAGSFVIGTLAFLTAHSWSSFFSSIIKEQTKKHEDTKDKTTKFGEVFYFGMYALIMTTFAVLVVFALIHFDVLNRKQDGSFAQFRPKIVVSK